ncbi:MAG: argininosuccinate synthase [Armatimonadetes bacterium]|nr:argininosuccinate synthase [Armatimonadota bacterium]
MSKTVALAFSGGLDTSWCVPYLTSQGWNVVTVTVDVGGFTQEELAELERKSHSLGAIKHVLVPAKEEFFETCLQYLLAGNVLRGGTYPLCVGAERSLQASKVVQVARSLAANAVAHGCTAAGNDQVRFELAIRSVAPEIEIIAPVRDTAPSRLDQVNLLESFGFSVPENAADYSVNTGLWGVTIGGKETAGTEVSIPEDQWIRTKGAFDACRPAIQLELGFEAGVPVRVDGRDVSPVDAIENLDAVAGAYGIGRGLHLGETILGIKGRVAFEAPAATLLVAAHRELEKLVLTKRQIQAKDMVAQLYGDMVHEGLWPEPACRDIEALLTSSQQRVTGTVHVTLRTGNMFVTGVASAYSIHAASRAVYGEAVGEWQPEDAKGFCRIFGLSSVLHARAGGLN